MTWSDLGQINSHIKTTVMLGANTVICEAILHYINCIGFQTIYEFRGIKRLRPFYSSELVNRLKSYTTSSKK